MAGRPKKPTALKLIEGSFRADRDSPNEMMPSNLEYAPSAPSVLPKDAKKVWKSTCEELILLGMLHRVDLELLAAYCNEMATYWEATKALKKEGSVIRMPKKESIAIKLAKASKSEDGEIEFIKPEDDGYPIQNPWVSIKNTALKNAQTLANQFGFTPAARARINIVPKDEGDPLTQLLKAKMKKSIDENK